MVCDALGVGAKTSGAISIICKLCKEMLLGLQRQLDVLNADFNVRIQRWHNKSVEFQQWKLSGRV